MGLTLPSSQLACNLFIFCLLLCEMCHVGFCLDFACLLFSRKDLTISPALLQYQLCFRQRNLWLLNAQISRGFCCRTVSISKSNCLTLSGFTPTAIEADSARFLRARSWSLQAFHLDIIAPVGWVQVSGFEVRLASARRRLKPTQMTQR